MEGLTLPELFPDLDTAAAIEAVLGESPAKIHEMLDLVRDLLYINAREVHEPHLQRDQVQQGEGQPRSLDHRRRGELGGLGVRCWLDFPRGLPDARVDLLLAECQPALRPAPLPPAAAPSYTGRGGPPMPYAYQIATSASQDRLEKLIAERLKPGSDRERIDARIWDLFGEQWTVMFTDLSGFSRRVAEFGIIHFLQTIFERQRILVPCIDRHDGILLKSEGDSLFVIFRSVRKALDCSLAMQRTVREYNRGRGRGWARRARRFLHPDRHRAARGRARVPGDVHAVAPGNGQAGPERTRHDDRSRIATWPSSCFP